jgi:putative transposase
MMRLARFLPVPLNEFRGKFLHRAPLITNRLEPELFTYLLKKANSIKCHIHAIGACEDHIHLVISIPPSTPVSDVVKRLKGSCSHDFPALLWQHGYGVVTVSEKLLPFAIQYVKNQSSTMQINVFLQPLNYARVRAMEIDVLVIY